MTMDSDTESDEELNADTEETAKASSNLKIIDLEALKQSIKKASPYGGASGRMQ